MPKFRNREFQLELKNNKDRVWRNTTTDAYLNFPFRDKIKTSSQFNLIARVFFSLISKAMTESGYAVRLPKKCGALIVKKNWTNTTFVDFPHYKKTQEVVKKRSMSAGTGAWVARFYWDKSIRYCDVAKKSAIKFVPTRRNKNTLTRLVKTTNIIDKYYH